MNTAQYDVIVLGSGIGGSTIAAILARKGFRVVMIEKSKHPRFALGEATLPQTSYWMWLISERYDVPELKNLTQARKLAATVATTCGVKRSLGFVYHREGKRQDMVNESQMLLAPEIPFTSESHFYRQDIDQYMAGVACGYGAELRERTEIASLDIDDRRARVEDTAGNVYEARYLVDASGYNSIVGRQYDLREEPTRLETPTRSIFTHVEGLPPYDDQFTAAELPGLKYRWHDGTLHHVFDGGWFWMIPFDNRRGSTNPRASVGVTLDMRKFPIRTDVTAEQEFKEIINRYPSIAEHMAKAVPVMPIISTGRLQYSHKRAVGKRFFITQQAYGVIDALYSRGMISTFGTIYTFAGRLIGALEADDFSDARFAGLDESARRLLDGNDQLVMNSYRSFANFDAWNAWLKIWLAAELYGDLWLFRTILKFMKTGDRKLFDELERTTPPHAGRMQEIIDRATVILKDAEAGLTGWNDATEKMLDLLRAADWIPHHAVPYGKREAHHVDMTHELKMPSIILWGKTVAPKWVRRELFDFSPAPLLKLKRQDKKEMLMEEQAMAAV